MAEGYVQDSGATLCRVYGVTDVTTIETAMKGPLQIDLQELDEEAMSHD